MDTAAKKPSNPPVSFPAGSYDRTALQTGLDKAVSGSGATRKTAVEDAVARSVASNHSIARDASLLPGHRLVEVKNAAGGIEKVHVYDPPAKAEATESASKPPASPVDHKKAASTASSKE